MTNTFDRFTVNFDVIDFADAEKVAYVFDKMNVDRAPWVRDFGSTYFQPQSSSGSIPLCHSLLLAGVLLAEPNA